MTTHTSVHSGTGGDQGPVSQLKAAWAETGRWGLVPVPEHPPLPSPREREGAGVAEGLSALAQGGLQMSSKLTLSEWRAFVSKPRQLGALGLSWLTYPAGGESDFITWDIPVWLIGR